MMDEQQIPQGVSPQEIIEEVPAAYHHPDFYIYQLDSKPIIQRLEHILRSEFWDANTNIWRKRGEPWMNEIGIAKILGIVDSHLSKEKILTDIPEDQVRRICRDMRIAIVFNFMQRWEHYGIKKADLDMVVELIDHYIYMNVSRSSGGRTLDFFKPTMKRIETIKPEERNKSILGFLPFGRG